jgi:hypothetical protein
MTIGELYAIRELIRYIVIPHTALLLMLSGTVFAAWRGAKKNGHGVAAGILALAVGAIVLMRWVVI